MWARVVMQLFRRLRLWMQRLTTETEGRPSPSRAGGLRVRCTQA